MGTSQYFCFWVDAMSDRLTQVQDAVDQLAQQFVAALHFIRSRHEVEALGPTDKIQEVKTENSMEQIDSLSTDEFQAGMTELSRGIITKEQQIEYLISMLPGLDNSEKDQERVIRELEEDLKAAEIQRQEALKERDQILAELDRVIQSIRRP